MALPGIAAGAIFTFALTLGDFITPILVGSGSGFIGTVIESNVGIANTWFIEKIDGQPTPKMAVWQIRNALRSAKPVHLQVLRGGQTKRDEFTIQQTSFHPLAITAQQFGRVAYIKVPFFEKGTAAQFRAT